MKNLSFAHCVYFMFPLFVLYTVHLMAYTVIALLWQNFCVQRHFFTIRTEEPRWLAIKLNFIPMQHTSYVRNGNVNALRNIIQYNWQKGHNIKLYSRQMRFRMRILFGIYENGWAKIFSSVRVCVSV